MIKKYSVYVMGLFYIAAGVNHFVHPEFYEKMLTGFLPYPLPLNMVSGAAEIILGAGVLIPFSRRSAAWGLILLLLAVYPANINMALHHEQWNFSVLLLYLRLPLQFLLIWWAYVFTRE